MCIKDCAAFVGRIWREGQPAEEVERRKGVQPEEREAPEGLCVTYPSAGVDGRVRMGALQQLHTSSGPTS